MQSKRRDFILRHDIIPSLSRDSDATKKRKPEDSRKMLSLFLRILLLLIVTLLSLVVLLLTVARLILVVLRLIVLLLRLVVLIVAGRLRAVGLRVGLLSRLLIHLEFCLL